MNELAFDDPCLVFALRRESAAFLKEFRPQQGFPGCPCWARFCGPPWLTVLALETGVGAGPVGAALDWLGRGPALDGVPYRPKLVLAAGFAGALEPGLQVGDVLLATEVADERGGLWPATWPDRPLEGEWRPPLRRARVLTAGRIVGDVARKRALGERHAAAAVDMESAHVAEWCRGRGVPFGCVRAVSDDARTPLSPRLAALLSGGRVSLPTLLAATVRSPGSISELWRLARATRHAGRQLALALGELLTLTLEWNEDR
jgi:adenosylhomocysteine nucleosidase